MLVKDILRQLKYLCKLVQLLEKNNSEKEHPSKFARVYGPTQIIYFKVSISMAPIYPDFENWDPLIVVRGKSYRMQWAKLLENEITNVLTGYKVTVRIENIDSHSGGS